MDNPNPSTYSTSAPHRSYAVDAATPPRARDAIDALEVFDMLRHLNDPEHPLTLEALNVASLDLISVDDAASTVDIHFTPTIPHCRCAVAPSRPWPCVSVSAVCCVLCSGAASFRSARRVLPARPKCARRNSV